MTEEAIAQEGVEPQAIEAEVSQPEQTEEAEKPEGEGEPEKAARQEDDAPFPKKAINAISRRDKTIGRLRAELAQAQARIAESETKAQPPQNAPAAAKPTEDQFDTYGEYLEALQDWKLEQRLSAREAKKTEADKTGQQEQAIAKWQEERQEELNSALEETMAADQQFASLVQENADIIAAAPQHIDMMFLQLPTADAVSAAKVLLSEDRLEALYTMPPAMAAAEIGRAIERGAARAKATPPVSRAPQPLAPAKGTAVAFKNEETMSGRDLLRKHGLA